MKRDPVRGLNLRKYGPRYKGGWCYEATLANGEISPHYLYSLSSSSKGADYNLGQTTSSGLSFRVILEVI